MYILFNIYVHIYIYQTSSDAFKKKVYVDWMERYKIPSY